MTNSKTMTEQEKKDQLWDQLIDLQEVLEMNETENQDALEEIFFLLDSMRGGYNVTEQVNTFLETIDISKLTLKQIKSDKEFMKSYMFRKQTYGVGTYRQEYDWYITNLFLDTELLYNQEIKK